MSIEPERIQAIRDNLGMSNRQFAELLNVPLHTAKHWLYGTVAPTGINLTALKSLEREIVNKEIRDTKVDDLLAKGLFGAFVGYAIYKALTDSDDDNDTPGIKDGD